MDELTRWKLLYWGMFVICCLYWVLLHSTRKMLERAHERNDNYSRMVDDALRIIGKYKQCASHWHKWARILSEKYGEDVPAVQYEEDESAPQSDEECAP